jgi:hypothetical protein
MLLLMSLGNGAIVSSNVRSIIKCLVFPIFLMIHSVHQPLSLFQRLLEDFYLDFLIFLPKFFQCSRRVSEKPNI